MVENPRPRGIDISSMPSPEIIVLDSDESGDSDLVITSQFGLASEGEQKVSSRQKKQKESSVGSDGQATSVHRRDHLVENGQMDTQSLHNSKRGEASRNGISTDRPPKRRGHPTEGHRSRDDSIPTWSRSPGHRCERSASPQSQRDPSDFFCIDTNPTQLPSAAQYVTNSAEGEGGSTKLLLPAHVSVFGTVPVEILPPSVSDEDEDYIDYLDYEDHKDLVRYFDDQAIEAAKPSRTVCKNCSAEGEHKTIDCPVLICLTCGARNEHLTRSCPISKTCFSCGMKGHINSTCPNRQSARVGDASKYDDCDRCGSRAHITNECPTLWRLYEYLTYNEKVDTIRVRQEKSKLDFGQGGEGYVAGDEWCYNCAGNGHWGDDCNDLSYKVDIHQEPSAFGTYNIMSGPFFDPAADPVPKTSRGHDTRDWKLADDLPERWNSLVPENVGQHGRKKNMAKMEKRAWQQAMDDEADDWFGNVRHTGSRDVMPASLPRYERRPPTGPKKLSFSSSLKDAGRQREAVPSTTPRLLDRLGGYEERAISQSDDPRLYSNMDSSRGPSRNKHVHGRNSQKKKSGGSYGQERDRDGYRLPDEPGPRYKGGYRR